MTAAEGEFREFATAFADPLTNLAFVLVAGDGSLDGSADASDASADAERARRRMLRALARTRRHWRGARDTARPEAFAVAALLSRLPRAARSAPPRPAAPAPGADAENNADADDAAVVRDAVWRAWRALPPRERVPLLFADVTVAARQLADLEVPDSFASSRRLQALATAGSARLRAAVRADPAVSRQLARQPADYLDVELPALISQTLARKSGYASAPVDSYQQVIAIVHRARSRTVLATAAALAVLVIATTVGVSTSRHPRHVKAGVATNEPSPEPDLPPLTVRRGTPDPAALVRAALTEADWVRAGEVGAGSQAELLWGGADDDGEPLVVVRVKTGRLDDLLIVAWSDGDGEYLLNPRLPDYPVGFAYPTNGGARVGVLAPAGVASAELVEDGVTTGSSRIDASGFASFVVSRPYPELALRTFVVRLYDAAGHEVSAITVPPEV